MRIFVASFGTFRRLFVVRPFIVQTTQLIYALGLFFSNYLACPPLQKLDNNHMWDSFLSKKKRKHENIKTETSCMVLHDLTALLLFFE